MGPVLQTKLRTCIQGHGAISTNKSQGHLGLFWLMGPVQQIKLRTCIRGHGASSTNKTQDMYSGSWGQFNKQNSGHVFRFLGPVQQTRLRTGIQGHGASSKNKNKKTNKLRTCIQGQEPVQQTKLRTCIHGHGTGSTNKTQDMHSGSWGHFNKQTSGHIFNVMGRFNKQTQDVFRVMGPVQQAKLRTCMQGHGPCYY